MKNALIKGKILKINPVHTKIIWICLASSPESHIAKYGNTESLIFHTYSELVPF